MNAGTHSPLSAIPLAQAQAWAERIAGELAPMAHRIEIAGSIRRRRPLVNDIDFVILPKTATGQDIRRRILARAPRVVSNGRQCMVVVLQNGLQIDVWFAAWPDKDWFQPHPGNWGTLLLCRTGSHKFNMWFAYEAIRRNLHWNPHWGLYRANHCMAAAEEADLFRQIEVPFINPEDREK